MLDTHFLSEILNLTISKGANHCVIYLRTPFEEKQVMKKPTTILFFILMAVTDLIGRNLNQLPTLQEAWVDAGYFEWNDESKTSLQITELGAEQETLPDVCDGEQLTNGSYMFSGDGESSVNLRRVPVFNTSNIVYFHAMFLNCSNLDTIPLIDTSSGEDFERMFSGCTSLKDIPLLDTNKGTNFAEMFSGCIFLKTIPLLNTKQGDNFTDMFANCSFLQEIPLLDTSNGEYFTSMFYNCNSLKSFPHLNTSKGIDFSTMFFNCFFLSEVPDLDTSKGLGFIEMFANCKMLKKKPQLTISDRANDAGMYDGTRFENE